MLIEGDPGVGKSTLLRVFAEEVAGRLGDPHSVHLRSMTATDVAPVRAEDLAGQVSGSGRALIALDDPFGVASKRAVIDAVDTIRSRDARIGVVVAVRPDTIWPAEWDRVPLKRFTLRQAMDLLELLHVGGTPKELERLAQASEGSPALLVELASIAATEPLNDVLSRLSEQHLNPVSPDDALFGELYVDGQRPGAAARELNIRVSAVSGDLIRALAERPELMYDLHPRRFEELLAELFARQGFDVELTKQTRDGGYDLWVVHHTPAGSLLTLVDAKRNRADRPVGVGIVRQLYGVVEATRASAGLIATTSFFSPEAKQFQEEIPFRLGLKDYFDLQTMLRTAARSSYGR